MQNGKLTSNAPNRFRYSCEPVNRIPVERQRAILRYEMIPDSSEDPFRALAEHYVEFWNELERAGLEPTDSGVWKVADELRGGNWVIYHDSDDGTWKVVDVEEAPKVVRHGMPVQPVRYEAQRLFVYRCPYCGGLAYNGDPVQGGIFRENALCSRCGRGFNILGRYPVSYNGPMARSPRSYSAHINLIMRYGLSNGFIDAYGHEHKGKGEGGGQFTSDGGCGGQGYEDEDEVEVETDEERADREQEESEAAEEARQEEADRQADAEFQKKTAEHAGREKDRERRRDNLNSLDYFVKPVEVGGSKERFIDMDGERLGGALQRAGFDQESAATIVAKAAKAKEVVSRKQAKHEAAKEKHAVHKEKWEAWKKATPKPDEPNPLKDDYTDAEEAVYDKQQAKVDAWDEKEAVFDEKDTDLSSAVDDAEIEREESLEEGNKLDDTIIKVQDKLLAKIDKEEDADPEPEDLRESAEQDGWQSLQESKDASGHERKGKDPGGGQFTSYQAHVGILRYAAKRVPKGYVVNKDGRVFRAGMWVNESDLAMATPVQGKTPATTKQPAADGPVAEASRQAAYHSDQRRARSVNRESLNEKIQPHTHHVLSEQELRRAKASYNGLHQHHEDLTGHRIEELINGAHEALQHVHPDDEVTRERLSKRLRSYHEMLHWHDAKMGQRDPWKGGKPETGKVYKMPTAAIIADPERFQFKMNVNKKEGVTDELKGIRKFDPELAGVVSVWQDPADGKTYVINGHHRLELAQRTGHPDLNVMYVDAPDAKIARARGAMVNIAEGRGTSVDAAKFMRDTGATPASMEEAGISLKGKLAAEAVTLTHLNKHLFDRVATGRLPVEQALTIASQVQDHDLQDLVMRCVEKEQAKNVDVSPRVLFEMARGIAEAPRIKSSERGGPAGLFDDFESEESLYFEECQLKASIRAELAKDVNDWKAVAGKRRVGKVTAGGKNELDVEGNKVNAAEASISRATFDRLVNRKGEISSTIKEFAVEFAKAQTQGEKNAIRQRALESVREAIDAEESGGGTQPVSPDPGGAGPGGSGGQEGSGGDRAAPDGKGAADAGRGSVGPSGLTDEAAPAADSRQPAPTGADSSPAVLPVQPDAAEKSSPSKPVPGSYHEQIVNQSSPPESDDWIASLPHATQANLSNLRPIQPDAKKPFRHGQGERQAGIYGTGKSATVTGEKAATGDSAPSAEIPPAAESSGKRPDAAPPSIAKPAPAPVEEKASAEPQESAKSVERGQPSEPERPVDIRGVKGTILNHLVANHRGASLDELRTALGKHGSHAEEAVKQLEQAGRLERDGDRFKAKKNKLDATIERQPSTRQKVEQTPKPSPAPVAISEEANKADEPVEQKTNKSPVPDKPNVPAPTKRGSMSYADMVAGKTAHHVDDSSGKPDLVTGRATMSALSQFHTPEEAWEKYESELAKKADYHQKQIDRWMTDPRLSKTSVAAAKADYHAGERDRVADLQKHVKAAKNPAPAGTSLPVQPNASDPPAKPHAAKSYADQVAEQTPSTKARPAPVNSELAAKIWDAANKQMAENTKIAAEKKAADARPYQKIQHADHAEARRTMRALTDAGFKRNRYTVRKNGKEIEAGEGWVIRTPTGSWETLTNDEAVARMNELRPPVRPLSYTEQIRAKTQNR